MSKAARLQQVIDHGAPAQSAQAQVLLARIDTVAEAEVDALYDAFLNDPYLTR
jgi:hypothetical protein